jgi:hypothetical protein
MCSMMNHKFKIIVIVCELLLVSCVNPIHVPRSHLKAIFDSKVGQDFSSIDLMNDGVIIETPSYKEYIIDKNHPCSVIIRVDKQSNIIESWRFVPPDDCYE